MASAAVTWNNFVRSRVWEPSQDDPDEMFQPELVQLDDQFAADMEGALVSIGDRHACAIEAVEETDVGGELVCWHTGRDKHGLLQVPDGIFVQVSAGGSHTCAIRADEKLVCWGAGNWASRAPGGSFLQVSSGSSHACAVRKDGSVKCFGQCAFGECRPPDASFVQVSAAGHAACGVLSNGTAACWGMGSQGTRGFGGPNIPRGVQFTQVSLSTSRTACGVTANSSMICWGAIVAHPDDGQVMVREGAFTMVSLGNNLFCGLKLDTTLSCDGDVFHLSREAKATPPADTQWMEVTTRHGTICGVALQEPHVVSCWGGAIADAMPEQDIHAAV